MERPVNPSITETVASGAVSHSSAAFSDEGRFIPGTLLGGRYRIIGLLGRGGMGEVYRATDLTLGQSVALKFLPQEAAGNHRLLERFHGEVRVARLVSHPNVSRVYDIGEVEGVPYISMEYVDGEDLGSLLTRIGRLPSDKAVETARKLCAGLAAAHDRGVIHRDLKPQNIMMNKRGEVVIMDFGLAAIADQLSGAELRNGTPAYMAPEQLKGSGVTAQSDIYSLGLVLYELFTGRKPFEAQSLQHLIDQQEAAHLTSMVSIASDIDPAVEKTIRRCLSPDPANRPASALAVSAALPGGDALAAALAAGETPSPEMVASAGKLEGLELKYSAPCLALLVCCLFGSLAVRDHRAAFTHAQLEYPADVLAVKSRELAAAFGYTKKPADSTVWFENRMNLTSYLRTLPGPKKWDAWLAAEAPVASVYRESQAPLLAQPYGSVTLDNPAPSDRGMVAVMLDGYGRLLSFAGTPYSMDAAPGPAVTPEAVFRAARFEMASFHDAPPSVLPRRVAEQVRAWKGPHPSLPDTEVTVQVATWKGFVTQALVDFTRAGGKGAEAKGSSAAIQWQETFLWSLLSTGAVFILLMVRRNLRLGRADRKGAWRIATVYFAMQALVWAGAIHPVLSHDLMDLLLSICAKCLLAAVIIWLIYMALEPEVRARWPHSIVTWNRILAGRWMDAQVGSHILIGATVGAAVWTSFKIVFVLGQADVLYQDSNLSMALGVRQWLAGHAARMSEALTIGLTVFMAIFGLRMLLRRDIFAALGVAVLFTLTEGELAQSFEWQVLAIFIAVYSVLTFVLLRFGLLATVSAIYFIKGLDAMALGSNWSAWYAPSGVATLALLLGIGLFAFWRSLGSREFLTGRAGLGG